MVEAKTLMLEAAELALEADPSVDSASAGVQLQAIGAFSTAIALNRIANELERMNDNQASESQWNRDALADLSNAVHAMRRLV